MIEEAETIEPGCHEIFYMKKEYKGRCYKGCGRDARIVLVYAPDADGKYEAESMNPMIVERIEKGYKTQWCVECMLRCENLTTKDLKFIEEQHHEPLPSAEELKQITINEINKERRNLEERACCCKRHIRKCCPSNFDRQIRDYDDDFPDLFQDDFDFVIENRLQVMGEIDEVLEKFRHLEALVDARNFFLFDCTQETSDGFKKGKEDRNEIGKILLWVGDSNDRYFKIEQLIKEHKRRDLFLRWFAIGLVFKVRTSCGHCLPRPYFGCKCKSFSWEHYENLVALMEDCGYFKDDSLGT